MYKFREEFIEKFKNIIVEELVTNITEHLYEYHTYNMECSDEDDTIIFYFVGLYETKVGDGPDWTDITKCFKSEEEAKANGELLKKHKDFAINIFPVGNEVTLSFEKEGKIVNEDVITFNLKSSLEEAFSKFNSCLCNYAIGGVY